MTQTENQPYVVAVSGGVDSIALLHMLVNGEVPYLKVVPERLIVAHFDHGIRPESHLDEGFVRRLAGNYGLTYVSERADLGPEASEETARKVRYSFLRQICNKYKASLITAHHQDDVLETMIINLIRGTGWRGLISLNSNDHILRPLLAVPKSEIISYAKAHKLAWREDSTNESEAYLRNYVRRTLLPRMLQKDTEAAEKLLGVNKAVKELDYKIATELQKVIPDISHPFILSRYLLIMLPSPAANEIIYHILTTLDPDWHPSKVHIVRCLHFIKTAETHKTLEVSKQLKVRATTREVEFIRQ